MTETESVHQGEGSIDLRQKAEEILQSNSGADLLLDLDKSTISRLLHELRVHQIELEMQNESLRQAQKELESARDRFQQLFQHAPVGYIILDSLGFISQSNKTFATLLDREPAEILKKPFSQFLLDRSQNEFLSRYRAFFNSPEAKNLEVSLIQKNGTVIHTRLEAVRASLLLGDKADAENSQQLWLTITDITERVAADERIKKSLKDKETLLQEIHHRVKNNMQVISSLLNLQARKSGNQEIMEALNKGRSRVYAMSIAHEILYSTDHFADIDLGLYVRKLTQTLFQSFLVDPAQISLNIRADNIRLDIKQATAIGLIVNELVSNALKYAFPNGRIGEISLNIESVRPDAIRLIIADDGIGLPAGMTSPPTNSLGLLLVDSLTKDQLNGRLEVVTNGGTCYTLHLQTAG